MTGSKFKCDDLLLYIPKGARSAFWNTTLYEGVTEAVRASKGGNTVMGEHDTALLISHVVFSLSCIIYDNVAKHTYGTMIKFYVKHFERSL